MGKGWSVIALTSAADELLAGRPLIDAEDECVELDVGALGFEAPDPSVSQEEDEYNMDNNGEGCTTPLAARAG